ncbi:MAG: flagellar hook-basal body protein [Peptostreptococcaceae bacterium]|nr:flagellar hook-basal body protein [Peptostreptococcaceae bacterium]
MNLSFYTGAVGAMSQQEKMDIISNNIANINTDGYRSKSSTFSGLIYSNMNAAKGQDTRLKTGVGVKIEKTDISMDMGTFIQTDDPLSFAITGEGFFGIKMPNGEIAYTRDGGFILSRQSDGSFFLATKDGYPVLGKDNAPIVVEDHVKDGESSDNAAIKEATLKDAALEERVAVFQFDNYNDMESVGSNRMIPKAKNGSPRLANEVRVEKGMVESSNVEFAHEMSKMIETQRAFQFALRMVTTSDEVEGIINSLRG